MDVQTMTETQRRVRQAVRAFLMVATPEDLRRELAISLDRGDTFRAECVRELMAEESA